MPDAELQQQEIAFIQDWRSSLTAAQQHALERAAAAIDLDYFGIDFSLLPDGRVIIFEANAAMRINEDYNEQFPYLREATTRLNLACQDMLFSRLKNTKNTQTGRSKIRIFLKGSQDEGPEHQ